MKNTILEIAVIAVLAACNNSASDNKESKNSADQTVVSKPAVVTKQEPDKTITSSHDTVSIGNILQGYLNMKNALANDNDKDAAAAGEEMGKAFAGFNKAALAPDKAKIYEDIQDDAKEHAEHISKNAGNIKHQREHFELLSKDIYELVKTFGGGQSLYYDHCPMYNAGKGAYWVSETKTIHNPYLGKSMPTCGTIKEELK